MDIIIDEKKLSERADEVDVRKDNKDVREIAIELKKVIREKNLTSLAANQTLAAYIVAEYVPTNAVQSSAITQTGATFKMTWAQS